MFLFSTSFGQVNLEDGLIVYYPFNGNCNDESGNGNNGTVNGPTLTYDQSGNANSAYEFDGIDDYINPVYPTLNSQSFSFCAWFKNYGFDEYQDDQSIFGGRTGTTSSIIYNMVQFNGYDSVYTQIKGIGGGNERPTIKEALYVLDNQWHFWTITSDSNNFALYLDGNLIKSVPQTISGDLTENALIGAYYHYSTSFNSFFAGIIDEVRIYNRALSGEEVAELYDLDADPTQEKLLYVKRGDPAGWSIEDKPGSQFKEMSIWESKGNIVTKMNLSETTITSELLSNYDVLRFNGYGGGGRTEFTEAEGEAIFNWVQNGGKCLAEGCWSRFNTLFTNFGIIKVSEHDDWTGFPYHGAPFNISPVTGPISEINVLAIEAMDQPILANNNTLTVDASVSGYAAVLHGKFGEGKIVFTLNEGWSHDATHVGNAYRSDIYEGDNLEFLDNVITYLESTTGISEQDNMLTNIKFYPNPASNVIKFKMNKSVYCQIFDSYGRLMISQKLSGHDKQIDISRLTAGIYLVRVKRNDELIATQTLIKQ